MESIKEVSLLYFLNYFEFNNNLILIFWCVLNCMFLRKIISITPNSHWFSAS